MRPIRVTVGAVGVSNPIPLDHYRDPFNVGLGAVLSDSATLTYDVQHTFDDEVRRLKLLESSDHLDLAVLRIGRVDREEPQEVQNGCRFQHTRDRVFDDLEPDLGRCIEVGLFLTPRPP